MNRSLFIVFVVLLMFCGVVFSAGDSLIPQPTYSVGIGLELEKMENAAQQLLAIIDMVDSLVEQVEHMKNQGNYLYSMFSNSKILNMGYDFADWSTRDWLEFVAYDIRDFMGDINSLIERPVDITLNPSQVALIDNFYDIVGSQYKTVSLPSPDDTTDDIKARAEAKYADLDNKAGYLNKIQARGIEKYASTFPGADASSDVIDEIIPGSIRAFVTGQQNALVAMDDNMLSGALDESNMHNLLCVITQLQIQNNQIMLKLLDVLADNNYYLLLNDPLNDMEKLSKEFSRIRSEENYRW